MNQNQAPDMQGMISRPGQYIHRTEGSREEYGLLKHYVFGLWISHLAAFGSLVWIALVLGPVLSGMALFALPGLLPIFLRAREGEENTWGNRLGTCLFLISISICLEAAWLFGLSSYLIPHWPTLFGFQPDTLFWFWRILLLIPPCAYLVVWSDFSWRLQNEIADPNWPGPISVRSAYYGPARRSSQFDVIPGCEQNEDALPRMTRQEMDDLIRAALGEQRTVESVRVEIVEPRTDGTGSIILSDEFAIPREKLQTLARGILQGRPFSELEWVGNNGSRPFSSPEFRALQDRMINNGWAYWTNPEAHQQGVGFTRVGLRVLQELT